MYVVVLTFVMAASHQYVYVLSSNPQPLPLSSCFITTLLWVDTHHPGPARLVGFVSEQTAPSITESPNDSGLTQLTAWIRKGLGKSHQYYLSGGLKGQRRQEGKLRTSIADIMMPRWCKGVE